MSVSSLQVLAENREALLLAEVAALLHDMGKFCNLHIEAHAKGGTRKWSNDHAYKAIVDNPAVQIQLSRKADSLKKPDSINNILNASNPKAADFLDNSLKNFLANNSLAILGEIYTLAELIMLGTPGFATDKNRTLLLNGKSGWLATILGVCHNEAHVDKQDPPKGAGMQSWPNIYVSNAFGFEKEKVPVDVPDDLDHHLKNLKNGTDRRAILKELAFGLGDTRQPMNEVLLSDWGWIVASLFKSAIAGALVSNKQFDIRQWKDWANKIIDHDLRWRLLRVNFDVLGLYAKAVKIADLLGYQKAVEQACNTVKQLVEEEYPLGSEIYRDTSGIYFTFPDLELPAELEQEIRCRMEKVEPELAPRIAVTVGDGATAQEQLKGILGKARKEAKQELAHPFDERNLSRYWQNGWGNAAREPGRWERCPVCGLRPKPEGGEACEYCQNRRGSRQDEWLQNPQQTIWLGEIADHNDRLALLVGKLGLDDWLSGDLVQTMLVKAVENDPTACVPKNASPARLRRIWETCQRFWDETVLQNIIPESLKTQERKFIIADKTGWNPGLYNGKVNGDKVSDKPLDLYWLPERGVFLTVSSLQADGEIKPGDTITLKDPDSKENAGTFTIKEIKEAANPFAQYQPWLALLASPDQFLVFLPASRALKIVQKIYAQYTEQFGKVRNRLPLSLGVVYFERRMPLVAVMDAAQHMLARPVNGEQWKVETDGNGSIKFENGIDWTVSTRMGDGTTEDLWYPYFELEGAPAGHHTRRFEHNGKTWVHVKDLKPGDTVHLTPSTFDFLWLDTASRRFDVHYDKDGRRVSRPTRPYYLEDLTRLDQVWEEFLKLTRTQLKQILQTIETTRERWFGRDGLEDSANDETFRRFVNDTLANAQWDWKATTEGQKEKLITAAARGVLTDLAELHLEILKEEQGEKR